MWQKYVTSLTNNWQNVAIGSVTNGKELKSKCLLEINLATSL